jgi:precorrin-6Y C5,15-methyltransferase (decarboxylating)
MTGTVTVIGCDGRALPDTAVAALESAGLIAGAQRHLDAQTIPESAQTLVIKHLDEALDVIAKHPGPVAVLASGDPGFFGIVRAMRQRGMEPKIIPAVSSVALAFARLGTDWDDALVLSAHGRDPRQVVAAALAHPKAAILTAPGGASLGAELAMAGRTVHVAERLGHPDERVTRYKPGETYADPNVLLSLDPAAPSSVRWLAGHPGAPAGGWALPEDEFEHRDSMITKSEVRALVLARLAPAPGQVIWDIGAGSGSVGVECARFGAWVIAVEPDAEQRARIRGNAARHHVYLRVREGRAPRALDGLPEPDAIFAGGGDNEVLAAALRHRPTRVVVTCASVDRVAPVHEMLAQAGYETGGAQLQSSRLTPLPNGSLRLAATNPVTVIWGECGSHHERVWSLPHSPQSAPAGSGA